LSSNITYDDGRDPAGQFITRNILTVRQVNPNLGRLAKVATRQRSP